MQKLKPHQKQALTKMKNGCILCGGTGSGKSFTSIAYYFLKCGGNMEPYSPMETNKKLFIITPAKKRDNMEWIGELNHFLIKPEEVVIDSWNNIQKYSDIKNAFFIFDEQRVVGYGKWSKAFIKIAKNNQWILLSATPGDTWSDYIPVFIANGFYRNKSQFEDIHVVYKPHMSYPVIDHYVDVGTLIKYRKDILVKMDFERSTHQNHITVKCKYDKVLFDTCLKRRWNPFTEKPFQNISELCQCLRRIVNSDISRAEELIKIVKEKNKCIIFYNYVYEKEIIKMALDSCNATYSEWNGQVHQDVPTGNEWCYLVQYTAGAEAWNCTTTDTIIFYSQNYSYKIMKQSEGRIDRLNTPFKELWYYHFTSDSKIDTAIQHSLNKKKKFNEKEFVDKFERRTIYD